MCLAVPAKVISVHKMYACTDTMGVRQKVNIQLVDSPEPGDYILVHAGFAIEKIDADQYHFLNKTLIEMLDGDCGE